MSLQSKSFWATTLLRSVALVALALLLGRATGPAADPRDPLEPLNRGVWQVNPSFGPRHRQARRHCLP